MRGYNCSLQYSAVISAEGICLQILANAKNTITRNFTGYIAIIVVLDFQKHFSIAKNFSVKFPGIFANIFQCKQILV